MKTWEHYNGEKVSFYRLNLLIFFISVHRL